MSDIQQRLAEIREIVHQRNPLSSTHGYYLLSIVERLMEFVPSRESVEAELASEWHFRNNWRGDYAIDLRHARRLILDCEVRGVPIPDWLRASAQSSL